MDIPALLNTPSPELGSSTEDQPNVEEGNTRSINSQSNPRLDLSSNIKFAESIERECIRLSQGKTVPCKVTIWDLQITRESAERQRLLELFPQVQDNKPSFARSLRSIQFYRTVVWSNNTHGNGRGTSIIEAIKES